MSVELAYLSEAQLSWHICSEPNGTGDSTQSPAELEEGSAWNQTLSLSDHNSHGGKLERVSTGIIAGAHRVILWPGPSNISWLLLIH